MERTDSSHLKAYFREKIPNEQKIAELDKYFGLVYGDSGVGAEVLSDYLAIKYLRNGIIHADRRTGHQAEFIRQRGFPVDSRQLKLSHLHKMAAVNATLLTYFGLPKAFAGLNEDFKFAGAPEAATSRIATDSQVKAPYSIKNFIQLHRRNLNNVGYKWAEFYDEISLNPLDRSMSVEIIEQLRGMDGKNPAHVRIASYGETALYSWTELTRLWPDLEGTNLLDDVDYRQRMLSVARSLVTDGVFLRGQPGTAVLRPILEGYDTQKFDASALGVLFEGSSRFSSADVLRCYVMGEVAYEMTSGIDVHWIWSPLVSDPSKSTVEIISAFVDLAEYGSAWYCAIEPQKPHPSEGFERLREMIEALTS